MYHSITAQDVGPRPAISPVAAPGMGRVLVVEDDLDRRRAIVAYLTDEKGVALGCGALEVRRHLQASGVNLVMLGSRLGAFDSLDILRQIRSRSSVPVIMYGHGHQADAERIVSLELGADDVLSGPLNVRELAARARAILRRQDLGRLGARALRGGYRFDGWEMRHATRELTSPAGVSVSLTKREYALLVALLDMPGRPLSRLQLMRATRTHEDIYDRSIDVQILRLRRKLEAYPAGMGLIRTSRGLGYTLDAHVEGLN